MGIKPCACHSELLVQIQAVPFLSRPPAPFFLINTQLYLHAQAAQWDERALAQFPLCDVTVLNMIEHPGGGWVVSYGSSSPFLSSSPPLLSSSPPLFFPPLSWGSFRGPEVTFLRPSSPVGLSAFVTLFLCLFLRGLPSPFPSSQPSTSSSSSLSPPTAPLPPPIPHGLAAVLNAQKRGAFTYITSAAQLMSWSISAV